MLVRFLSTKKTKKKKKNFSDKNFPVSIPVKLSANQAGCILMLKLPIHFTLSPILLVSGFECSTNTIFVLT